MLPPSNRVVSYSGITDPTGGCLKKFQNIEVQYVANYPIIELCLVSVHP